MIIYRLIRRAIRTLLKPIEKLYTHILFQGNGIIYSTFRTNGTPFVMIARGGKCSIGKHFSMNNGIKGNPIGSYRKCTFFVDKNGNIVGETYSGSHTLEEWKEIVEKELSAIKENN